MFAVTGAGVGEAAGIGFGFYLLFLEQFQVLRKHIS